MIQHNDIANVQLAFEALDAAGRPVEGVTAQVPYRCRIEPLTAEETTALGFGTADMERVKVFAKSWPEEPTGEIEALGKRWKQVGPAKRRRAGAMTRHVTVILERL